MDISKINPFLENMGFNAAKISNPTDTAEIQKFAQENGISVNEAEKILKTAEAKANEKENLFKEYSEIQELLQSQDEEEIIEIEDLDFDTFLNEENPEQKMQEILAKQQFLQNNLAKENQNPNNENPFLKTKW